MTNRMNNLRITDFDGENVAQAVSFFRGGRTILSNNNFEPPDFDDIIFESFKTSSTPTFNALVTTMQTNKTLGVPMIPLSIAALGSIDPSVTRDQIDDCLQALETSYMDLVSKGKWLAKSDTHNHESTFTTDSSASSSGERDKSKLTCFNCGKAGHGYPDCDLPLDQARIKTNRENFLREKRSSSSCNGGGSGGSRNDNNTTRY